MSWESFDRRRSAIVLIAKIYSLVEIKMFVLLNLENL